MSDRGPHSEPVLSLPKSGGALQGLGETFQPNPFTGTLDFSIPIAASPGREGFGPALALQYGTANGNGPFGLGWQLSLPQIARRTEKGLPTYAGDDVFVMSGAEELVPVLEEEIDPDTAESRWVAAAPETLIAPAVADGSAATYTVTRYRPRTEGLFARIEKWVRDDGDVHWRAHTSANVTSIYGLRRTARIVDPAAANDPSRANRVFAWLLEETYDGKGNHLLYEYAADAPTAPTPVHEVGRAHAQKYLRRVLYGNSHRSVGPRREATDHVEPLGARSRHYHLELVFDYGDVQGHDYPARPAGGETASTWPLRPDPFSSYRAGFEIRTTRRCRRALMFHHFSELGGPTLVRSTDFAYEAARGIGISLLASITLRSYERSGDAYRSASLPPASFEYSAFEPGRQRLRTVTAEGGAMPPSGLGDPDLALVDLFGRGLPDVLQAHHAGHRYWRNLGEGRLDRPHPMHGSQPTLGLGAPGVTLADTGGDGSLDLVQRRAPVAGFFESDAAGGWLPFRPFRTLPTIDPEHAAAREVDLTGDGLADLLVTLDHHFLWYRNLGEDGYAPPQTVPRVHDLDAFPDISFDDPGARVRLADMGGDGLADIVLLHNGRIDYWPNLGHGRFGRRVTMSCSPRLGHGFDPARLFLVDLDGTGCSDLVYVGYDTVRFWLNRSGNGWSEEFVIAGTPLTANVSDVRFADLYGTGTSCLLWSRDAITGAGGGYQALDFCNGTKPHLLVELNGNRGATTRVRYAPSTRFYLEDERRPETRWLTRLPFPVLVVEKIEVFDSVSRTKRSSSFRYRHGYFDGREREFRGFGRVDKLDTEDFESFRDAGLHEDGATAANVDRATHRPPVLEKTWYHTGLYHDVGPGGGVLDEDALLARYRSEYHGGDTAADAMGPNLLPPAASDPALAFRALRGTLLRKEVYGLDDSELESRPYTVTERRRVIVEIQGRGDSADAVYLAVPHAEVVRHYERTLADPRVTQDLTLEFDRFGMVTRSARLNLPRRDAEARAAAVSGLSAVPGRERALRESLAEGQGMTVATVTDKRYARPVDAGAGKAHRHGLCCEIHTTELLGLPSPAGELHDHDGLRNAIAAAADIAHGDRGSGALGRRLVERKRTIYWRDDVAAALPLGESGALGLVHAEYALAFPATPLTGGRTLLESVYAKPPTAAELATAGYHLEDGSLWQPEGHWWLRSGTVGFDPSRFCLGASRIDPFGQVTAIEFDDYDLMLAAATDPLGNRIAIETIDGAAGHDYRVLQPLALKDANGNVSEIRLDTLGAVTATAQRGAGGEGDALPAAVPAPTAAQLADPVSHEQALLGTATTRTIHDPHAIPAFSHTLSRETHGSDLPAGHSSPVFHTRVYTDGFGRAVQTKSLAEPGTVPARVGATGAIDVSDGRAVPAPGVPARRWVASGWSVFDNKGKPVRSFEPYFTDDLGFEADVRIGVGVAVFHDPLGRVVASLRPDHSYEKVIFTPWLRETWDANDTVLIDPRDDPDVAPGISAFLADYRHPLDGRIFAPWYDERIPDRTAPPAPGASDTTPAQRAALKAAAHAATPSVDHIDSQGRAFLTVADNGVEKLVTLVERDIKGNTTLVIDARGNVALTRSYDAAGRQLAAASPDAGASTTFPDVLGAPVCARDSNGNEIRHVYDALRRPTELRAGKPVIGQSLPLAEMIVYGEAPGAVGSNLRGKPWRVYDGAGLLTNAAYDFKGNPARVERRLPKDGVAGAPDWSGPTGDFDEAAAEAALEAESHVVETHYDAQNRAVRSRSADGSVQEFAYNEAGLLASLHLTRSAPRPDGTVETISESIVTEVEYDEAGRRRRLELGNGVVTTYAHDAETQRLVAQTSRRASASPGQPDLQNLRATYDPVGNATEIHDAAQATVFNANQALHARAEYAYDPVYRLIEATGREHVSSGACRHLDRPNRRTVFHGIVPQPAANTLALQGYREAYSYDEAGNLIRLVHTAPANGWTRTQTMAASGNRLLSAQAGCADDGVVLDHDDNGNPTRLPHLPSLRWDARNRLVAVELDAGADPEMAHYQYDAGGQRVRKTVVKGGVVEERVYLGASERYRRYRLTPSGRETLLERETVHVMDDRERVALVETRRVDAAGTDPGPASHVRYQLADHLGSSVVELEAGSQAKLISREEYYPYGGSSYLAHPSGQLERAAAGRRRYRYCGKERDEETGLDYFGARFYASWLGRWTNCDPAGAKGGLNLYRFNDANPIMRRDPDGRQPENTGRGEAMYRAGLLEIHQRYGQGTKRYGIDMKLFVEASETGFSNLSTKQLDRLHGELMEGTLDQYEDTDVHDFLVESIANVALERAKRRAEPGATNTNILSSAQVQLYTDYRETGAHGEAFEKFDRKSTIYRDAERLLHGAKERSNSLYDAITTEIGDIVYNGVKKVAGGSLSTSGDRPTPPGGSEWLRRGFDYGSKLEGGDLPEFENDAIAVDAAEAEMDFQREADEALQADLFDDVEVAEGDTLWSIAERELGDPKRWPELWEANQGTLKSGDPHLIYPKESIKVPTDHLSFGAGSR